MTGYRIDPVHSSVIFMVQHLGINLVTGRFRDVIGLFSWNPDSPELSQVTASIDPLSLYTGNEDRDEHLKGPDFFNVRHHPAITFESTAVKPLTGNAFDIVGTLDMLDCPRQVTFHAEYRGAAEDQHGKKKTGFSAEAVIDRIGFGLGGEHVTEQGVHLVGNKVKIILNVEGAVE